MNDCSDYFLLLSEIQITFILFGINTKNYILASNQLTNITPAQMFG